MLLCPDAAAGVPIRPNGAHSATPVVTSGSAELPRPTRPWLAAWLVSERSLVKTSLLPWRTLGGAQEVASSHHRSVEMVAELLTSVTAVIGGHAREAPAAGCGLIGLCCITDPPDDTRAEERQPSFRGPCQPPSWTLETALELTYASRRALQKSNVRRPALRSP